MNLSDAMKSAAALRAAARVWRAGLRPARWSFAAAVGVVAALSVPLVAAGTPSVAPAAASVVIAQPSVAEGATNAQGDRLLAGADRYATAVLLAEVPLDAGTREVLVVSGESLVDAVSAASVAASRDAAIVLTATDAVPEVVAEFIAGRGFDRVTLGGGARLTPRVIDRAVAAARGNPDTDDDNVDAGVDAPVLSVEEIAAAHGANVVIEDGFIKLIPPAGRTLSEVYNHAKEVPTPDDALPVPDEWFARPGVVDPYLWQPEIPVLEANVEHDGDGQLSPDERYPLGSPARAAYLIASGGDSPPGATVLAAPAMILRRFDEERDTTYRLPAGIPVPPGAPDRLTTTFEERDATRAARLEAYSGGKSWGNWALNHRRRLCKSTPENNPNSAGPAGVPSTTRGITCETAADWYLWMCDTLNESAIKSLGPVDAWLATFDRFYEQWVSQMPATWMFHQSLEEARVTSPWALELENGQPWCTSNDNPANANSPENIAAHEARMAEITAWTAAPTTIIAHSHGPDGFTSASGRWLALRDVSESKWLRNVVNENCYGDVRYCGAPGLSIGWDLRALA